MRRPEADLRGERQHVNTCGSKTLVMCLYGYCAVSMTRASVRRSEADLQRAVKGCKRLDTEVGVWQRCQVLSSPSMRVVSLRVHAPAQASSCIRPYALYLCSNTIAS